LCPTPPAAADVGGPSSTFTFVDRGSRGRRLNQPIAGSKRLVYAS